MKKIYFLAFALVAFTFSNAQIVDDNMEFYNLGEMGTQNPATWTSWSNDGGADNTGFVVTDAQAMSGAQSLVAAADEDAQQSVDVSNLVKQKKVCVLEIH